MKPRPYHNPADVDESKVPDGWRFRYEGEWPDPVTGSMYWNFSDDEWSYSTGNGCLPNVTYIVPVNS